MHTFLTFDHLYNFSNIFFSILYYCYYNFVYPCTMWINWMIKQVMYRVTIYSINLLIHCEQADGAHQLVCMSAAFFLQKLLFFVLAECQKVPVSINHLQLHHKMLIAQLTLITEYTCNLIYFLSVIKSWVNFFLHCLLFVFFSGNFIRDLFFWFRINVRFSHESTIEMDNSI